MELGLRLGDTLHDEKPLNDLIDISNEKYHDDALGFCMRLTRRPSSSNFLTTDEEMNTKTDHPSAVQLHLLPFSPLPNPFPCLLLQPQNQNLLNLKHSVDAGTGSSSSSSPNSSMMSSFRKEFAVYKRDQHHHHNHAVEADHRSEYTRKRGSDDEDEKNGVLLSRKKLRLTKDQSAFLEHSFKLHHTILNPKQKLGLAKQLKLRPRQVEVWFQNRRARTKLKQTEVDCEYLKRCCETLREENKRLQKEVQELRALKSCKPNYMQLLPPTTLTMCPSCERLTPPTTVTVAAAAAAAPPPPPPDTKPKPPRLHTFLQEYQSHALQAS